jgi:hypothetical protein
MLEPTPAAVALEHEEVVLDVVGPGASGGGEEGEGG